MIQTLTAAYPNMALEVNKFQHTPRNYWKSIENQKQYFDQFALDNGFNPLILSNWTSVPKSQWTTKLSGILLYYDKSLIQALSSIYPGIGSNKVNVVSQ